MVRQMLKALLNDERYVKCRFYVVGGAGIPKRRIGQRELVSSDREARRQFRLLATREDSSAVA